MLNFNHLYYFHVAATEGSVGAAADKLGVKQSTVSEQLRALERTLGARVFERSSTGVRLTKEGQIAFEHSTAIFRAGERLLQALGRDLEDAPITLRVGTSGAVARATSADFLLPLFELDGCIPTIMTGESLDLLRALRGNELDLVLCESELTGAATDGLEHVVIRQIPLVAITASGVDPGADWRDAGIVQYRAASTFHWEVEAFLEARGLRPRVIGEADDPFLLVEAAAAGRHVVIVPRSVAREAVESGRVRVLAQLESGRAAVHALYQDGTAAELARRAIAALVESTTAKA